MEINDNPIKVTTTLKVVITGEFYDNEASEETLKYWVEQDLEDDGFDVSVELLKEQEAIMVDTKVIGTFNGDMEVYCCRDCRTILDPAFHYCPNCGRAVKWE